MLFDVHEMRQMRQAAGIVSWKKCGNQTAGLQDWLTIGRTRYRRVWVPRNQIFFMILTLK